MAISDEELRHNRELLRYYPLGMLNAVWHILETFYGRAQSREEDKALTTLLKALHEYDDAVRKTRFRLKKNQAKK